MTKQMTKQMKSLDKSAVLWSATEKQFQILALSEALGEAMIDYPNVCPCGYTIIGVFDTEEEGYEFARLLPVAYDLRGDS